MDSTLRDKFILLLRSVFLEDYSFPEGVSFTVEECETLMRFGNRQSISPIIYQGITQMPSKDLRSVIEKWEKNIIKCKFDFIQRDHALNSISHVLEKAHIPYIPLKGAIIKEFYPQSWFRTSSDIDVLVHEEDISQAIVAIEKETGFKSTGHRSYHDVPMLNNRLLLELHFSIKENLANTDPLLEKVWSFSEQKSDCFQFCMNPHYLIFYTLAHMNHHLVKGGLGIRPCLDLWLLEKKASYDRKKLDLLLIESNLKIFHDQVMAMIDAWLLDYPMDEKTKLLERYCLSGGVFGNSKDTYAARQRNRKGVNYIIHRLFVSRAFLQEEYPDLRDNKYLFMHFQFQRWKRLRNLNKRKKIKHEIRSVNKTSKEEIQQYDAFLKSLGL